MRAVLAAVLVLAGVHAAGADVRQGSHDGMPYRLSIPESRAPGRPLVVALHGCAQTAEDFARGTRLDRATSHDA